MFYFAFPWPYIRVLIPLCTIALFNVKRPHLAIYSSIRSSSFNGCLSCKYSGESVIVKYFICRCRHSHKHSIPCLCHWTLYGDTSSTSKEILSQSKILWYSGCLFLSSLLWFFIDSLLISWYLLLMNLGAAAISRGTTWTALPYGSSASSRAHWSWSEL